MNETHSYRDNGDPLTLEVFRRAQTRNRELEQTVPQLRKEYGQNERRRMIGITWVGAFVLICIYAPYILFLKKAPNLSHWSVSYFAELVSILDFSGILTGILLAAWPASVVLGQFSRLLAVMRFDRLVEKLSALCGEPIADLAKLRQTNPIGHLQTMIEQRKRLSNRWFLTGAALLMPMTIHFAILLMIYLVSDFPVSQAFRSFDLWILASLALTAPVHGYFAWASWNFPKHGPLGILLRCTALSLLPFVLSLTVFGMFRFTGGLLLAVVPIVSLTATLVIWLFHRRLGRELGRPIVLDQHLRAVAGTTEAPG